MEKEDLEELVGEVYKALKNADDYLAVGEQIVSTAKPALVKALALLLGTFNDVRKDLGPQLAKHSSLSAKALHRDYRNYVAVGFTKDQAFKLVLAAIKPLSFTDGIGGAIGKSIGGASTKNKE